LDAVSGIHIQGDLVVVWPDEFVFFEKLITYPHTYYSYNDRMQLNICDIADTTLHLHYAIVISLTSHSEVARFDFGQSSRQALLKQQADLALLV